MLFCFYSFVGIYCYFDLLGVLVGLFCDWCGFGCRILIVWLILLFLLCACALSLFAVGCVFGCVGCLGGGVGCVDFVLFVCADC